MQGKVKVSMLDITCKAHTVLPLSELVWFQGNLAEASKESKNKLAKALERHGIFKAFDVWDDGEKKHIIDGHARCMVLKEYFGYKDERVPVNFVLAKSLQDAKEKVLLSRSQSNKTTEQGLFDFTQDLDWEQITQMIDIPSINIKQLSTVIEMNELTEWENADMPEFISSDNSDIRVVVHFESIDDADRFVEKSELITEKKLKNCYICKVK